MKHTAIMVSTILVEFRPNPERKFFCLSSQYGRIERSFLNFCNGLICITKPQQELYTNDFVKIPCSTIPLGSPPPFIKILQPGNIKKHIVYTGRAAYSIEDRIVFDALARCRDIDVKFSWIGLKRSDLTRMKTFAEKAGVSDIIDLIEWMPYKEMRDYINRMPEPD